MVQRLNGALYRWLSRTQLKWSTDAKNTNSDGRSIEERFTVSGPFTQCPRSPEVALSPLSGELSEAHRYDVLVAGEFIKHLGEWRLVGSRSTDLREDRTLTYFVSYLVGSYRAHYIIILVYSDPLSDLISSAWLSCLSVCLMAHCSDCCSILIR